MSIQDLFFLFGIIYMVMGIVLMIIIGVVLIVIKNKITDLYKLVDEKVTQIQHIADDPTEAAISLGTKMAGMAVQKVKSAMNKKSKE
ncbi:hypothetical protein BH09PAT1_BH09PAT1_0950 [soil metagenome]